MLKMLHKLRRQRTADEAGLTVIEMLVAMIVLAIIMTPLLMSFITSLTVADSTGDQYRTAANRDRLASFLSRDASSVDAAGVSLSSALGCKTADQVAAEGGSPAVIDTLLVSFSTTRLEGDGSYNTNRSTYWVSGSGKATELVRRSCIVDGGSADNLKDGVQNMVATRIGSSATTATSADHLALVHGPVVAGSIRRNPCDEISCTIVVAGENAFQSTAQRRVFGAGVPVEINQLYSSSALPTPVQAPTASPGDTHDLATQTANRLDHISLAGTAITEARWPGYLSLASGIDPKPEMKVRFRLQQRFTTGGVDAADGEARYYQADGTWALPNPDPDLDWVNAEWDLELPGQWALPISATQFTRGGEYRVWAELDPASEDKKVYGGSDPDSGGFPLWFDWKLKDSVFVDAASGNDTTNDGRTPNKPVKTFTKALAVAYDDKRPEIHVLGTTPLTAGTISATGAGQTHNNTAFIGGYGTAGWTRGAVGSTAGSGALSTIVGLTDKATSAGGTGVVVDGGVRDIRFRQMSLDSGATADWEDGNHDTLTAYGLKVLGGSGVILEQSKVTARDGFTPWKSGIEGAIGTSGCLGQQGAAGNTSTNTSYGVMPESLTDPNGNPYLVGPQPTNCTVQSRALRGGHGGAGGSSGSDGARGTDGRGLAPGAGREGRRNACSGNDNNWAGYGGNRPSGQAAATSGYGGGKGPTIRAMGTDWQPANGQPGGNGKAGSGGGGSGGGGRNNCLFTNGGQGASGGDGGQGGKGGEGGLAGGSSFGIYLFGASSSAVIRATVIESGDGGNGKDGGNGGNGGQGGAGGPGNSQGVGGSTSGAGGGSGGDGGGLGGTGEGGWSVPVITDNARVTVELDTSVILVEGQAGQPGDNISDQNPNEEWVSGKAGYGGTGGASATYSAFFELINWTTRTGADGARGLAATYPSGNELNTIGKVGEHCLLWVGGVGGSCATP